MFVLTRAVFHMPLCVNLDLNCNKFVHSFDAVEKKEKFCFTVQSMQFVILAPGMFLCNNL